MLSVKQFTFNPFGESTFVVYDSASGDAIVVDPGMVSGDERRRFEDFVASNKLHINQIVNTHLHVDHCFGNNYVRTAFGAKAAAHPADFFLGERVAQQTRTFGVIPEEGEPAVPVIDIELADGDSISVGEGNTLEVICVPGHSPGSIALYSKADGFVITGDALFAGSIGRTDLPGGSMPRLVRSVTERLLSLPDDTVVLPGHGPATTIARERRSNPYL